MRKTLLIGLALLEAGCAPDHAPPPTTEASGTPVAQPGKAPAGRLPDSFAETAWRSTAEDGTDYTTYIDADGTYRDLRNGAPWQTGRWTYDLAGEHRLCFTPDAENAAERCWRAERTHGKSMDMVGGPEARHIEVQSVRYAPPTEQGDEPT